MLNLDHFSEMWYPKFGMHKCKCSTKAQLLLKCIPKFIETLKKILSFNFLPLGLWISLPLSNASTFVFNLVEQMVSWQSGSVIFHTSALFPDDKCHYMEQFCHSAGLEEIVIHTISGIFSSQSVLKISIFGVKFKLTIKQVAAFTLM